MGVRPGAANRHRCRYAWSGHGNLTTHAVILRSRKQVRNCLAYVLNNWRHHDEDRGRAWQLDPFSSAVMFEGWKEREARGGCYRRPPSYVSPLVWEPKTWLLSKGWQLYGLISAHERPGTGHE